MKQNRLAHEAQRFSIRKYSFGATSVMLGCMLVLNAQVVAANQEEQVYRSTTSSTQEEALVLAESTTPTLTDEASGGSVTVPSMSHSAEPLAEKAEVSVVEATVSDLDNSSSVEVKVETDEEAPSQTAKQPLPSSLSIEEIEENKAELVETVVSSSTLLTVTSDTASSFSEMKSEAGKSTPQLASSVEGTPPVSEAASIQTVADLAKVEPEVLTGLQQLAPEVSPIDEGETVLTEQPQSAESDELRLPSKGSFIFKERTAVKNEPMVEAVTQFFAEVGQKINYDRIVISAGYQWISYQSSNGLRRYAAVAKEVQSSAPATPKEAKSSGTVVIENPTAQGFDVVVKDISSPKELDGVSIPVWSAQGGQDDLVWYAATKQADNTYKAMVKTSDHKGDAGDYHIHVYYRFKDGTHNIVAATKTTVAQGQLTGHVAIPSQGRYTFTEQVNVKNEAKLSAKTEFVFNKGESVNYDRTLDADNHQWISYISYSGTRRYIPIAALKLVEHPTVASTAAPTTAPTVAPAEVKMSGQVDIQNQSAQGFDVVVKNVTSSKELAEVQVPVWSAQGGQDDLVWYVATKQADDTYKATVKTSAHKGDTGDYHVHVYFKAKDGAHKIIATTKTVVPTLPTQAPVEVKLSGKVVIENPTAQGFDVVVKDISSSKELDGVSIPVWSAQAGQDDLVWYAATKQADNTYKATVKTSDHKGDAGDYHIHVYYRFKDGTHNIVAATKTTVAQGQLTGHVAIPSQGRYTFTEQVNVKNEAKLSAKTEFVFNKGESVNYDRTLDADNHQWISYVSYSGTRRYIPVAALKVVEKPTVAPSTAPTVAPTKAPAEVKLAGKVDIQNISAQGFDVVVKDISSPKELDGVSIPVWSAQAGQDDLVWYAATKQADNTYKATVKTSDHKGDAGDYHIHVYYRFKDGSHNIVAATKTNLTTPTAAPSTAPTTAPATEVVGRLDIPSQGRFTFGEQVNVKNEAKLSAKTEFVFNKGESVNYDRTLDADNHQWISYVSYSGTRRYIPVAALKVVEKPTVAPSTAPTVAPTKAPAEVKLVDKVDIQNISAQGFDVVVKNVTSPKELAEVQVPVWSAQGGQDDLVWYVATKQADNTYKTTVKTSAHKGDTGDYHVHVYFKAKDGEHKIIAATKTVVPTVKQNELTYNGNYYVVQGKYEPVLIVNKTHAMSATYNPGEDPTAKAAFVRLRDDMINRGFNVGQHYSGFRSYETQQTLYQNYVARDGQAQADRYSARPGHSEHQSGLAYDLTDRSGQLLTDTQATAWLKDNAHHYGFVVRYPAGKEDVTGYMQEDWHIRYIGKEANEVKASGLTLEEYYGVSGGTYESSITSTSPATTSTLPVRGTFTFGTRAEIKAEAKKSSPVLAYYEPGQSVNYDTVLQADGLQWISYIASSGVRRYIAVNN